MTTSADQFAAAPEPRGQRRLDMIRRLNFELVPMKSVDGAIAELPPGSIVSVTCSPVKGIPETMRLTDQLRAAGHTVIPHLAARMVSGPQEAARIAGWFRTEGIDRAFVIGGDADPPAGPYTDAASFLRDLLDNDHGLAAVGFGAYPDGHASIPDAALDRAIHEKAGLLAAAGVDAWASTQMCFDPSTIRAWLTRIRVEGFTTPVHLGLPGVVDRTRLIKLGVRLGIGTSLSYLRKNRAAVGGLLGRSSYDPDALLVPLSDDLAPLGVEAIHCFTFNQVAATESWRREALVKAGS
ncbi:MAG: hypothetical protein AAF547_22020 [Actinomycetota bacterium]